MKKLCKEAKFNAEKQRSRCLYVVNRFQIPYIKLIVKIKNSDILDSWKKSFISEANTVKTYFNTILTSFVALEKSENDLLVLNLSIKEYEIISKNYSDIADKFEKAISILGDIDYNLKCFKYEESKGNKEKIT